MTKTEFFAELARALPKGESDFRNNRKAQIQKALYEWAGDDETKYAFAIEKAKELKAGVDERMDARGFKNEFAINKTAKTRDWLNDQLKADKIAKSYTEWRAAPEQVEKSVKNEVEDEFKTILGGYGRKGMADEKDVEAYREAANRGIEKPEEFAYDMDAAIARFQNPNLQAAIDRGTAAIERSATARGMNDGTDLRKVIADYATSKASEDYQKAAQLAAADKQAQLEAWRSKAQLGQNADATGLSALQILAGYGNANVGTQTGLELGSKRYGFDTTETAYQTRYAQQLAQEEAEKNRKAAKDQADKQLAADIIGGFTSFATSAIKPKA